MESLQLSHPHATQVGDEASCFLLPQNSLGTRRAQLQLGQGPAAHGGDGGGGRNTETEG